MWPSGLRRVTRNHFSYGGVGSNPAIVVFVDKKEEKDRRNRKSIRYRQEWPSGPRRSFQVRVSSEAWVRTPPLAF